MGFKLNQHELYLCVFTYIASAIDEFLNYLMNRAVRLYIWILLCSKFGYLIVCGRAESSEIFPYSKENSATWKKHSQTTSTMSMAYYSSEGIICQPVSIGIEETCVLHAYCHYPMLSSNELQYLLGWKASHRGYFVSTESTCVTLI
jgi:hypothetical protein